MAETAEQTQSEETTGNGGNGSPDQHDTRKTAVRAAAIAAASGATALAAKRAFSSRGSKSDDERDGEGGKPARKGGNESMLTSALASGWDSARHTLVPMLEDAAATAGEYVAQNAPDIVTDTLVPEFIRGFERGQKQNKRSPSDENETEEQ
jgi:hypothetical protein